MVMVMYPEQWEGSSALYFSWLLSLAAAAEIDLIWGQMEGDCSLAPDPLRDFLHKAYFKGKIESGACSALADRMQELIPSLSAKKLIKGLARLPARNRWRKVCGILPAEHDSFTQTLRDCTVRFIGALRAAAEHGDSIELN